MTLFCCPFPSAFLPVVPLPSPTVDSLFSNVVTELRSFSVLFAFFFGSFSFFSKRGTWACRGRSKPVGRGTLRQGKGKSGFLRCPTGRWQGTN